MSRNHKPLTDTFSGLLWLEGYDLTPLELRNRKRLLRTALTFQAPIRYGAHRDRVGEKAYREACARGLEGVVAKRAAGKVGTGFDQTTLRRLDGKLRRLFRARSPFDRGDPPTRGTHWVQPALVAQFGFTQWTRDGRLRHPRYLGLRHDKHAVVRERPGTAIVRRRV
jgi:bifunctional non-homologous end joining protein LigD